VLVAEVHTNRSLRHAGHHGSPPLAARLPRHISGNLRAFSSHFPDGRKAHVFLRERAKIEKPPGFLTIDEYYGRWIERRKPPTVAPTTYRDYKNHHATYIKPTIGSVPIAELRRDHLEDLRVQLRAKGLAEKTIKNVLGGSLRALVRDAIDDGVLSEDPFKVFRWSKIRFEGADPHTEDERERILDHLAREEYRSGRGSGAYRVRTHYDYFAAVHTLYFTGMRPSELSALRIRDADLFKGVLFVRGSRVLRQDGPSAKTESAVRRVGVDEKTVELLKPLIPLHSDPDAYLFHAPEGSPIDQDKLNRIFCDAQRVLGIRLRGLYATKDTFCSVYLSNSGRIEWLSQQTGVAEGTLRKHYASYLRRRDDDTAELAKLTGKSESQGAKTGSKKG